MHDVLAQAEKTGDLTLVVRCLTYLTFAARKRGDMQQVQSFAERSLLTATTVQMPDYIGAAQAHLAWLAWRAGNLGAVQQHGAAALSIWQKLPIGYMFEWTGRWPLLALHYDQVISSKSSHVHRFSSPKNSSVGPSRWKPRYRLPCTSAPMGQFTQCEQSCNPLLR